MGVNVCVFVCGVNVCVGVNVCLCGCGCVWVCGCVFQVLSTVML